MGACTYYLTYTKDYCVTIAYVGKNKTYYFELFLQYPTINADSHHLHYITFDLIHDS